MTPITNLHFTRTRKTTEWDPFNTFFCKPMGDLYIVPSYTGLDTQHRGSSTSWNVHCTMGSSHWRAMHCTKESSQSVKCTAQWAAQQCTRIQSCTLFDPCTSSVSIIIFNSNWFFSYQKRLEPKSYQISHNSETFIYNKKNYIKNKTIINKKIK